MMNSCFCVVFSNIVKVEEEFEFKGYFVFYFKINLDCIVFVSNFVIKI